MTSLIADKIETYQMKVDQLSACLEKYRRHFGLDDDEDRGAKLHLFVPLNIDKEISVTKEVLQLLRTKTEQVLPTTSGVQAVLKSIQDRQHQEDNLSHVQNCFKDCIRDIRDAMQDLSLKTVVKKLEAVTTNVGLRFDSAGHSGTDYFISSDMFYVEVQLDTNGNVLDVKVQSHSGDPKQCKELMDLLRKREYEKFEEHLRTLTDLYDLQGDTFVKSKILSALEAVETDIQKLGSETRFSGDIFERIQRGPVGLVLPRHGVNLMKLVFCAHPHGLISERTKKMFKTLGPDDLLPSDKVFSVSIAVESSDLYKLQTVPLLNSGDSTSEQYTQLDNNNSEDLPASFVMKLDKVLPISAELVESIHRTTNKFSSEQEVFSHCSSASLDNLILKQHLEVASLADWKGKEFHHVIESQYHVCSILSSTPFSNIGLLISRIPFQHPSQISSLIQLLRRQAVFNLLLTSCAKRGKRPKDDLGKKFYYDVGVSGPGCITMTFRHPLYTSIASVDFRVLEDAMVHCQLHVVPEAPMFCSNDYLSKIANKSLSIPITMRCMIRKASAFVPGNIPTSMMHTRKDPHFPSEKLTLKLPQLQFADAGGVPLVSPGIYSSPGLTGFSASSLSPSGTAFQFGLSDPSHSLLHAAHSSALLSPAKNRGSPIDRKTGKGRTIPKITIKLKNGGSEYEIDKEKSEIADVTTSAESQLLEAGVSDENALGLVYSDLTSDVGPDVIHVGETTPVAGEDKGSVIQAINFSYGTSNPFELTVDSLTAGGVANIGDLDSLLVPGIDPSSLVGTGLVSQFSLPGSAFSQEFADITGGSENQVEAFDLDAITSGGSRMEFSVDDALSAVSASAIDPSMVVSSSGSLPGSAVFDVDPSLIDIDQFMLSDQGNSDSMDASDKS